MKKSYCESIVVAIIIMNCAVFCMSAEAKAERLCRAGDISVSQGASSVSGIPRYRVEITNLCSSCRVSKLHLHCGMFASANVVNPKLFKRIAIDDCLVNAGRPLPYGNTIAFQYSNTRPYTLSVASYSCL